MSRASSNVLPLVSNLKKSASSTDPIRESDLELNKREYDACEYTDADFPIYTSNSTSRQHSETPSLSTRNGETDSEDEEKEKKELSDVQILNDEKELDEAMYIMHLLNRSKAVDSGKGNAPLYVSCFFGISYH
jgi:hypothetical protein